MAIVCLMLLGILVFFSHKIYRSFINPLNLFLGINLVSIILMYATSIIDDTISSYVWFLIFIMMFFYVLGVGFEGKCVSISSRYKFNLEKNFSNMERLKLLIFIYSIIFDIFALYYLYHLNSAYGIQRMMQDMSGINSAMQTGEFEKGIY